MPFGPYKDMDDCMAQNQDKDDPGAYCAQIHHDTTGTWPNQEALRHPDFQRIHTEFTKYYCHGNNSCRQGDNEYYQWINDLRLDESKPYADSKEQFHWAKDMIRKFREDTEAAYYKVLIGFPIASMNNNVYSEEEWQRVADTLEGVTPTLNHDDNLVLHGAKWVANKYEDGAMESILRVEKNAICPICDGKPITQLIDSKRIVNVSLEASCENRPFPGSGEVCQGMTLHNATLLTSDRLPGIPMARIFPLESIMSEALTVTRSNNIRFKQREQKKRKTIMVKKKGRIKVEVQIKDDPNKPAPEPTTQPDDNMQCPDGQRWSDEQGKCVPSTDCPEGQVWSDEMGQCIDIKPSEPEGTTVSMGSQVPDTSKKSVEQVEPDENGECPEGHVLQDGVCVKQEQVDLVEPDENGECPEGFRNQDGVCVKIEEPKPEPEEQVEPDADGNCPEGYVKQDGVCVKKEKPDDVQRDLEYSTAMLRAYKAEAESMSMKQKLVFYENELAEKVKSILHQQGEIKSLKEQAQSREQRIMRRDQSIIDRDISIKERENRIETLVKERGKLREEMATDKKIVEQANTQYESVNAKYQDILKTNLDLSKRLTKANEDYLTVAKENQALKEALEKMRRVGKRIRKIRVET